jgi:hypothetical protein
VICLISSVIPNNRVAFDTYKIVTRSNDRGCLTAIPFLSPLATFSTHPDQFTLSLFLCLSLHTYPASESGNAVRDLSAEAVIMRTLLNILRAPAMEQPGEEVLT